MVSLILGLLGFVSAPSYAFDSACLRAQQKLAIERLPQIPSEILRAAATTQTALEKLPREDQTFARMTDKWPSPTSTSLEFDYKLKSGGRILSIENNFSPGRDSTDVLEYNRTLVLVGPDGVPIVKWIEKGIFEKTCLPRMTGRDRIYYTERPDLQKYAIRWVNEEPERIPREENGFVSASLVKESGRYRTAPYLQKLYMYFRGFQTSQIDDTTVGFPVTKMTIKNTGFEKIFDPLQGKLAQALTLEGGLSVDSVNNLMQMKIKAVLTSGYSLTVVSLQGREISYQENLKQTQWMTAHVERGQGIYQNTVSGFVDRDFTAGQLRFEIQGTGKAPTFVNSGHYLTVASVEENNDHWKMVVSESRPAVFPNSVPWTARLQTDEPKYLRGSKWIQLDAVDAIVQELTPQLKDLDRLQAAKVIIKKITTLLTYDDHELNEDRVGPMTTREILAKRSGVCQHYAALFVAIARRLGIPARIMAGDFLWTTGLGGHAWIEVKINDQDWWPLDPQYPDVETLPYRSYLPLYEYRIYEADAGTAAGEVKTSLDIYQRTPRGMTIKKLPLEAAKND